MPEDLIKFAWSAPMRDLASQVGLSDVGLKKLLNSYDIVSPPQGHWNKVIAGKPVTSPPKPQERRPGEHGRIRIDQRFAKVVPVAAPLPSTGPFASKHVPEDLAELRSRELQAIGTATVPKSLDRPHKSLRGLLAKEAKRKEKAVQSRWDWNPCQFDSPVAKRKLRLMNAIFLTLAKRGHDGDFYEREGEIESWAVVGNTRVGFDIVVSGSEKHSRHRGGGQNISALPLGTPLTLLMKPSSASEKAEKWVDDDNGKLESKIAQIVASLITEGESSFRRGLREAEERIEAARIASEKRRQEKLIALNRQRVEDLHKSAELLRQARDIRLVVAEVRAALAPRFSANPEELRTWEAWALTEADKIDPVLTGQVHTHIREPTLPPSDDEAFRW